MCVLYEKTLVLSNLRVNKTKHYTKCALLQQTKHVKSKLNF